tara:strand:- start:15 stop:419 length:405 start_codon:yes stop_codon:yes gene_type:complete
MRIEKIETFNKENLKQLREAINNSLGLIGRTFGIEIKLDRVSYRDYNFTGKLVANLESKDGELFTPESIDYKNMCERFGLEPEWLGKEFIHKGKSYTVIGLAKRAREYPIICESGNHQFKFPALTVKEGFRKVS